MLRAGSIGAEVAAWQAFLAVHGYAPGPADGVFGAATEAATRAWQEHEGLEADGVVGPASYARAYAMGWRVGSGLADKWRPSRWFTPRNGRDVRLIVIHTTEGPETPYRSDATAEWFASDESHVSAHYVVDPAQVVQCVRDDDDAWHAGPVNGFSIGIEHNGTSKQSAEQWADEASTAQLQRSARLAAELCRKHGIPARRLGVDDVRAGRGFVGHVDVTDAYGIKHGHRDPGEHFPWDSYLEQVQSVMVMG